MISRSQMNRQLYMGGGITQLPMNEIMVPRGEYGLGSIVKSVGKAVKGVAKGIGDIAKSDIGKAALLYAGTAGLSSLGAGGGFGSLFKLGTYAPSAVMGNIGALFAPGAVQAGTGDVAGRGIFRKAFDKLGTAGLATTALGGLTGYLASQGMSNEEIEEIQRDPATLSTYLRQYYTNLNPELINQPEVVDKFVKSQLAEYGYATGGRVGFSEGTNKEMMQRVEEILKEIESKPKVKEEKRKPSKLEELLRKDLEKRHMQDIVVMEKKAYGGPMGEPRENKGGIMELDYRKEGGFVPVGIKEKADDVPAMLSKNEFVFTADAVRGAGEGSVDKGAERLYNIMKTLGNGGTV